MKNSVIGLCMSVLVFVGVSCTPSVPDRYIAVGKLPVIYPDYIDVTIPQNIAPLVFEINEKADKYVTRLSAGAVELLFAGQEVAPSVDEWRSLMQAAADGEVRVEVYTSLKDKWCAYTPFAFKVSPDSIDPYISYRLIPPSYVAYERLSISQRNISTYDEDIIYNNMLVTKEPDGQCINCHAYKNYRTDNMQFHVRQYKGGTVFVHNGEVFKVNMATDSTLSAGVYPAFNPVYDVVAYSVNKTGQIFHTKSSNKVEVQDVASDVILFNPSTLTVTPVANDTTKLEVFPWWSPDGRTIYYCSSHFPDMTGSKTAVEAEIKYYKDVKYSILRRSWNPETGEFGEVDTVFNAAKLGKSATFPRVSPTGKYLLFAMAEYGCFHIWHNDADLYVMDLETGDYWPLTEANSPYAESYHSWSSTGRWILFASRRDDTNYSRLYIAYVGDGGRAEKAFLLPQQSADFYNFFDRSYNVPEFMLEPVRIEPYKFAEVVKGEPRTVKFVSPKK